MGQMPVFLNKHLFDRPSRMLSVISGTNRPQNNSEKVTRNYCELLSEMGVEHRILDLQTLPEDFAFNALYGKRLEAVDAIISEYIVPFQKFVFVVPEYNGSYPGVLKTFLDCVPPNHFYEKKAALIGLSDGAAGNQRGLDHLTNVLNYLKVDVLSRKPKLSNITSLLSGTGNFTDERSEKLLREQIEHFLRF